MLKRAEAHLWVTAPLLGVLLGCGSVPGLEPAENGVMEFVYEATQVRVEFHGEVTSAELFGDSPGLPFQPAAEDGAPEGSPIDLAPSWLRFTYSIGAEQRTVLVARRPLMNYVSWDAIARAGGALGNDAPIVITGVPHAQDARVRAADGNQYRVRLPWCGQSTMALLSEWNLVEPPDRGCARRGPGLHGECVRMARRALLG